MPQIGEQSDVLRALGWFLDAEAATGIEIKTLERSLAISWDRGRGRNEQRMYQEHDLDALRARARALRQVSASSVAQGTLADLLRTLGQHLDGDRAELVTLAQEAGGFRVSSISGARYHTDLYHFLDLVDMSDQLRAQRSSAAQPETEKIDPLAGVTLGAPVFTKDDQRLGKVGDVRGDAFKVEAPFFQRNYWLPGSCIASASPGEPLVLTITRSQAEERKQSHSSSEL